MLADPLCWSALAVMMARPRAAHHRPHGLYVEWGRLGEIGDLYVLPEHRRTVDVALSNTPRLGAVPRAAPAVSVTITSAGERLQPELLSRQTGLRTVRSNERLSNTGRLIVRSLSRWGEMDILERYPGSLPTFSISTAASSPRSSRPGIENPIATKKSSTASTKPGGPAAATTPAMNFEVALDLLIATAITCLRHDNPKLRRAVEIASRHHRELSNNAPRHFPAVTRAVGDLALL